MEKLEQLAANIEFLRQKVYALIAKSKQSPDPEVIKLNQDLDKLIVEYTRLHNQVSEK